jgi:hypothetical protein
LFSFDLAVWCLKKAWLIFFTFRLCCFVYTLFNDAGVRERAGHTFFVSKRKIKKKSRQLEMSGRFLKETGELTTTHILPVCSLLAWENNYNTHIYNLHNSLVAGPTFAPARQGIPTWILLWWRFHSLPFQGVDRHQCCAVLLQPRPAHPIGIIITFKKPPPTGLGPKRESLVYFPISYFWLFFFFFRMAAVVWLAGWIDRSFLTASFSFLLRTSTILCLYGLQSMKENISTLYLFYCFCRNGPRMYTFSLSLSLRYWFSF